MMCIFHSKAWCMVIAKVSADKNVKFHPEAVSILQLYYYTITAHVETQQFMAYLYITFYISVCII